MAAQAQVKREDSAIYDQATEVLSGRRGNLEARNEEYEAWSESTAGMRDIAGKAQKELERRGHEVPDWAPEEEQPETETAEPQPEPELEAEVPDVEASEPEMSPEAGETVEAETEPVPAGPGAV
jgi:hypothetical protein